MSFLNDWSTPDYRELIHLDDSVLHVFVDHAQVTYSSTESGGILLGRVRGEHLEIIEATKPTHIDRCLRYLFERSEFFHQHHATARWVESLGTVRYLGAAFVKDVEIILRFMLPVNSRFFPA
jgi:hypothetical protein